MRASEATSESPGDGAGGVISADDWGDGPPLPPVRAVTSVDPARLGREVCSLSLRIPEAGPSSNPGIGVDSDPSSNPPTVPGVVNTAVNQSIRQSANNHSNT